MGGGGDHIYIYIDHTLLYIPTKTDINGMYFPTTSLTFLANDYIASLFPPAAKGRRLASRFIQEFFFSLSQGWLQTLYKVFRLCREIDTRCTCSSLMPSQALACACVVCVCVCVTLCDTSSFLFLIFQQTGS